MKLTFGCILICPDDDMSVCGDDGVDVFSSCGNLAFLRFFEVVGEEHSFNVNLCVGCIVQLNPVALLEEVADVDVVCCTYFINFYRMSIAVLQFRIC